MGLTPRYDSALGIIAITAREDIEEGGEVLLDYGADYWKSRQE